MKIQIIGPLVGILLLVGCGGSPSINAHGNAVLQLFPGVKDGHVYAPNQFGARAIVKNYTKASINHLVLKVFTVDANGSETPGNIATDVPGSALTATASVKIAHLSANTRYRVRAYAYKAAGLGSNDLISDPKASIVDVTVTNDDRPTMATIPVKLMDVAFDGEATSSVSVIDGGYLPAPAATISFQ